MRPPKREFDWMLRAIIQHKGTVYLVNSVKLDVNQFGTLYYLDKKNIKREVN